MSQAEGDRHSRGLRYASSQPPLVPRILGLVYRASPGWTTLRVALVVLQGAIPLGIVLATRSLIDLLASGGLSGAELLARRDLLVLGGALVALIGLAELLKSVSGWVGETQGEIVRDHLAGLVHEKAVQADLSFYETPAYYDQLHRAKEDARVRPAQMLDSCATLLQAGVTALSMVLLLASYTLWIPLLLLVTAVPGVFLLLHESVRRHRWAARITPQERRAFYYDYLLTAEESAAEIRVFDLGDAFRDAYQSIRRTIRDERFALGRKEAWGQLLLGLFGLLGLGVACLFALIRFLAGALTLGDLALFYQAFERGQSSVRQLVARLRRLYVDLLFVGNLTSFLDLEPSVVTRSADPKPFRFEDAIRFENVSFRYPGTEALVLRNIDLELPKGSVTALVGPNGAGKTTLLKLLCRLYDPSEGRITIDGVDLRELDLEDYRRRLAVLFQTPLLFHGTAAENVGLGDLVRGPDEALVHRAAEASGADEFLRALPDGYRTELGRTYVGGHQLSGGQWQRISLARAFYRQAPLLLLDEPTSSMDPWSEQEWLRRMRDHLAEATALIVTHRPAPIGLATSVKRLDLGRLGGCTDDVGHLTVPAAGTRQTAAHGSDT
ncbi:MAG: ABC transporter ATP-binding protein [Acidobacteria bacterium]|nr:MAG: ABC transporter ATP-binding protein [Acidobacteriota bacterium]